MLISFAVTAKLICVFVFAYAKNLVFSQRGSYEYFNHKIESRHDESMIYCFSDSKFRYFPLRLNTFICCDAFFTRLILVYQEIISNQSLCQVVSFLTRNLCLTYFESGFLIKGSSTNSRPEIYLSWPSFDFGRTT